MSVSGVPAPLFRVLLDLFPGKEIWRLVGGLAVSLAAAAFETIGVASILPFMMLVLDPTALNDSPLFQQGMRVVGITTTRGGLLLIGSATAAAVTVGNIAGASSLWVLNRLAARTEARLASTLFAGYLRQPYGFHLWRDAPSLFKVINSDVHTVSNSVVVPLAVATSRAAMAVGLLGLLIYQDPVVAFGVAGVLIGIYLLIYVVMRRTQRVLGEAADAANEERVRAAHEGFGGVKELQVLGRLELPTSRFAREVTVVARLLADSHTALVLPKYILETVAFVGILLVTLIQVAASPLAARSLVPVLAMYAFAGYRLMPALQHVFSSAAAIRFAEPVLRSLHADFLLALATLESERRLAITTGTSRLRLRKELRFDNVSFTYQGAVKPALKAISLGIRASETIGLVGRTGAGKTTLADLILGLYEPDAGSLTVDGHPLAGDAVRQWRRSVGYVSQSVYLANATVRENIAFGTPATEIDDAAVLRAGRMAQADEFIAAMPGGYDALIGERGVRLSGGQRQRLGIARALYHDPDVLVFDEATSALDGLTEDAVMDAIRSLSGERTIILIAHRLRTIEACDRIIVLEGGELMAEGTYRQLMTTSEAFRQMVGRQSMASHDDEPALPIRGVRL